MASTLSCKVAISASGLTIVLMAKRVPFLNSRMQGFGTTIFAEMSALATETKSINLGQGFPDSDGPIEIAESAIDAIRNGHNQYPPGSGIASLRFAIAKHQSLYYDLNYNPDTQILVTAGATEAIAASLLAICEIGDEVITFEPFYDSYAASIALAGAKLVPVRLHEKDWSFTEDDLVAAITPRTKAIIVNTPHNPTGKVFTKIELAFIASLCIENDIIAITDEVYEHIIFTGEHHPLATFEGMNGRCISISSAAKTFSFTGWKIGWVTASKALIDAVRTTKQFLTYVNGAPFQVAIAFALDQGRRFCDQVAPDLKPSRNLLSTGLAELGMRILNSDGTYFLTTDISTVYGGSAEDFCRELPRRFGVVAIPSTAFYQTPNQGNSLVRWAFCKQPKVIEEALERMAKL